MHGNKFKQSQNSYENVTKEIDYNMWKHSTNTPHSVSDCASHIQNSAELVHSFNFNRRLFLSEMVYTILNRMLFIRSTNNPTGQRLHDWRLQRFNIGVQTFPVDIQIDRMSQFLTKIDNE